MRVVFEYVCCLQVQTLTVRSKKGGKKESKDSEGREEGVRKEGQREERR